ncbi:MAG: outer membrane beta-barrel protein [Candidatus Aenigmarchaeota archaeon]|nr:outer membrane beta-barrel protein [Candidatus Aenigmarchaeota archaeon]
MRKGFRQRLFIVTISTFTLLAIFPALGHSEFFFNVYFGTASTQSDDVHVTIQQQSFFGSSTSETTKKVEFSSSSAFGLGFGYWFKKYSWFGLAADLGYLQADGENVDINVIPLSGLLMFRYPLFKSNEFPNGKLQPYLGMGFTLITADMSVDFRPDVSEKVDGTAEGSGPIFKAGLAWQFLKKLGVFGEFRYFRSDLDIKDDGDSLLLIFTLSQTLQTAETNINAYQFVGGLTYRF